MLKIAFELEFSKKSFNIYKISSISFHVFWLQMQLISRKIVPFISSAERARQAAEGCLVSVAAKLVKTATKNTFANFQTYIRVKINRAGKFGPFLLDFCTLSKMTFKYTSAWK